MKHIADRVDERSLFGRLLAGGAEQRVVLVSGRSGMGKTSLLRHLGGMADTAKVDHVYLDLEGSPSLADLLNFCALDLPDEFARVLRKPVTLPETGDVSLNLAKAEIGHHTNVEVTLNTGHVLFAAQAKQIELMAVLRITGRPLVFLVDNYQCSAAAPDLVQFVRQLAMLAARNPHIVIVVAGENTPPSSALAAEDCVKRFELSTIVQLEHWLELARAVEPAIPLPALQAYLQKLCATAERSTNPMNLFIMEALLTEIDAFQKDPKWA